MGILGNIERALGVWYPDKDTEPDDGNPLVALAFRDYVIKRLGNRWSATGREERELGEPDLLALRNSDEVRFDIVTCYRSRMFVHEDGEAYLPWTTQEIYDKYLAYAKSEGNPFYVVFGLHGYADVPKFIFVVPLDKAVIDLKKSVLQTYEVPVDRELL
ncbi:MAG TPA: hypothetical protein VJ857_02940 [Methanocorpusculum sp.]|nr:hypothetical protein [Methanocorpusculum sp.]HJJ50702.1 hypothetical protein [Methanocorpusculum sp.]HKL97603.1 hypothetical protein [Methanocorpusculum sp.]